MNDVPQKLRACEFPILARIVGPQRERPLTRTYPKHAGHERRASSPRRQDVNIVGGPWVSSGRKSPQAKLVNRRIFPRVFEKRRPAAVTAEVVGNARVV